MSTETIDHDGPRDVTPFPSGEYGAYVPPVMRYEKDDLRPTVQVAERVGDTWYPTPARYFAETVRNLQAPLAIDFGQGWYLTLGDSRALARYARDLLAAEKDKADLEVLRADYPIDDRQPRAEVVPWKIRMKTTEQHLADAARFLATGDIADRLRAHAAALHASRETLLPPGTWAVWSTYRDGWGGEGRIAMWSAHLDEAAAREAHAIWAKHWADSGRNDYETHVGQRDDVKATYLYRATPAPRD